MINTYAVGEGLDPPLNIFYHNQSTFFMLILCSNGLSSINLQMQTQQHLANSKKAALVVTADNEYKEQNYHVPRCIKELEALELTVDIFDLDKDTPELLLNYDVVEFIGGNPFYLLHSIRSCHAEHILQIIANEKNTDWMECRCIRFRPYFGTGKYLFCRNEFLRIRRFNSPCINGYGSSPSLQQILCPF